MKARDSSEGYKPEEEKVDVDRERDLKEQVREGLSNDDDVQLTSSTGTSGAMRTYNLLGSACEEKTCRLLEMNN